MTTDATTSTTTTAPATTAAPTATLESETVGDPAALEAHIRQIAEGLVNFYPDLDPNEVPIPDLTNPDPTVAVDEGILFGQWVAANYPAADWAVIETFPDSPELDIVEDNLNQLFFNDWRRVRPAGSHWTFGPAMVVDIADLTLPPTTLDNFPAGAVAVLYDSTSGPLQLIQASSGEVFQVLSDGWEWRSIAIMVPTREGWRTWDTVTNYDED